MPQASATFTWLKVCYSITELSNTGHVVATIHLHFGDPTGYVRGFNLQMPVIYIRDPNLFIYVSAVAHFTNIG